MSETLYYIQRHNHGVGHIHGTQDGRDVLQLVVFQEELTAKVAERFPDCIFLRCESLAMRCFTHQIEAADLEGEICMLDAFMSFNYMPALWVSSGHIHAHKFNPATGLRTMYYNANTFLTISPSPKIPADRLCIEINAPGGQV